MAAKKQNAAQATAHLSSDLHSVIGSNGYTNDMGTQGWIEFRFYSHGAADMNHESGCPGCDPAAPSRPELAPWFRVESKWAAKGEPPRCPVRRREWCAERGLAA